MMRIIIASDSEVIFHVDNTKPGNNRNNGLILSRNVWLNLPPCTTCTVPIKRLRFWEERETHCAWFVGLGQVRSFFCAPTHEKHSKPFLLLLRGLFKESPKFLEMFFNPFWRQQPSSLLSVAADVF